jgi:hypothetical protein
MSRKGRSEIEKKRSMTESVFNYKRNTHARFSLKSTITCRVSFFSITKAPASCKVLFDATLSTGEGFSFDYAAAGAQIVITNSFESIAFYDPTCGPSLMYYR